MAWVVVPGLVEGLLAAAAAGTGCVLFARQKRRWLRAAPAEAALAGDADAVRRALAALPAAEAEEAATEVLSLAEDTLNGAVFAAALEFVRDQVDRLIACGRRNRDLSLAVLRRRPELSRAANSEGWTVAVAAAVAGDAEALDSAIRCGASPDEPAGLPPLCAAAANGHVRCVDVLVAAKASLSAVTPDGWSALQLAARGGRADVVARLLKAGACANLQTGRMRQTPLHSGTAAGSADVCRLLLAADADVTVARRDGATPLHTACTAGSVAVVDLLLARAADDQELLRSLLTARDQFGQTPLHVAASRLHVGASRQLVAVSSGMDMRSEWPAAAEGDGEDGPTCAQSISHLRDTDGATPLTAALRAVAVKATQARADIDKAVEPCLELIALLEGSAALADSDGATALHCAACVPGAGGGRLVSALVDAGADCAHEDGTGWSALHLSMSRGHDAASDELRRRADAEWLATFDASKPRGTAPLRPPSHIARVPEAERKEVLGGSCTVEAIATRLRDGRSRRVVVLVGAGISTGSGVPDYRSDGGIYKDKQAFSEEALRDNPEGFYRVAAQTFFRPGVRPNAAHYLLALLADKGLLQRVYTQNIDELEEAAGVPADRVVYSHGNLRSFWCLDCGRAAKEGSDEAAAARSVAREGRVPKCGCGGVLRPGVVFFGESLPARFDDRDADVQAADLLLVIGTSLVVYPFAAIPNEVGSTCPRLLLNREEVGPWRGPSAAHRLYNYRDVALLGDCCDGARALAFASGWCSDLDALAQRGAEGR